MISAVILAAGESRRMGKQNKLLLRVGGEAMLVKLVKVVCASDASQILIVIGHEAEQIRQELYDLPINFVYNPNFSKGMTTSIKSGIKFLSLKSLYFFRDIKEKVDCFKSSNFFLDK